MFKALVKGMGNVVDKIVSDKQEGAPKNVLEMYQKLINMGYSEQMAILAAKKHPKHIVKAIDWIDHNEIKSNKNEMDELQRQIEQLKLSQQSKRPVYNVYNQTVYNKNERHKDKLEQQEAQLAAQKQAMKAQMTAHKAHIQQEREKMKLQKKSLSQQRAQIQAEKREITAQKASIAAQQQQDREQMRLKQKSLSQQRAQIQAEKRQITAQKQSIAAQQQQVLDERKTLKQKRDQLQQRERDRSRYDSVIHESGNSEILRSQHRRYGTDEKGRPLYQGPKGGIYRLTKSGSKAYVRR